MSRTKKPSKLSADERAFLNRICSLNEEETEKLTWEEMIAYLNIMHKMDPRWLRNAFEESFIDRGLTNYRARNTSSTREDWAARRMATSTNSGGIPTGGITTT
jgi:hypothetical protein